jgi:hypothetical protein
MDGKQKIVIAVISVALVCAVACVTADSSTHTPLFRVRMEQASSEKNFLPTEQTPFTYTAESTYTLTCEVSGGCSGIGPLYTGHNTCQDTCPETCEDDTCEETTCATCYSTCTSTCPNTCTNTCPSTCTNTCPETCEESCAGTCWTCPATCVWTCSKTCDTCYPTSRCCP